MVVKVTLVVIAVILALAALGIGVMAARGVAFQVDLSSPGPINMPARPITEIEGESVQKTPENKGIFRFAN